MSHVVATIYCNVYRMEFSVKNYYYYYYYHYYYFLLHPIGRKASMKDERVENLLLRGENVKAENMQVKASKSRKKEENDTETTA